METDSVQLEELRKAEKALRKHGDDLLSEWEKPLTVDANGYITGGVLWIPGPFKVDFWSNARKKPKLPQCICSECGRRHARKE